VIDPVYVNFKTEETTLNFAATYDVVKAPTYVTTLPATGAGIIETLFKFIKLS